MARKFDVNNAFKQEDARPQQEMPGNSSIDDLFGEDYGNDIFALESDSASLRAAAKEIDIKKVKPSPRNPYKVLDNEDMEKLIASIDSEGILNPLIARPIEGGYYELVSGHRRLYAAKKLKLKKVPVVVKDMTDEQADVWMVDLNLNRETILPSEKAKAIKLKYDAIKKSRGGKRESLGEGAKYDSAEIIAKEMGMSDRNLRRYIVLADLDEELMDRVDCGKLTQKTAEQLAYLTPGIQKKVEDYLSNGGKLTQDTAKRLKLNFAKMDNVKDKDFEKVLKGKAKKPVKATSILIKLDKEIKVASMEFPTKEKDVKTAKDKIESIRAKLNEIEQKMK